MPLEHTDKEEGNMIKGLDYLVFLTSIAWGVAAVIVTTH